MGNHISSFWSSMSFLKKGKRHKGSKKKKYAPTSINSAPAVAPMYESVANVPTYAVVDKGNKHRKPVDDSVQYADIEIVQKPKRSQKKKEPFIQNQETTEYATLNFPVQYNPVKGTLV